MYASVIVRSGPFESPSRPFESPSRCSSAPVSVIQQNPLRAATQPTHNAFSRIVRAPRQKVRKAHFISLWRDPQNVDPAPGPGKLYGYDPIRTDLTVQKFILYILMRLQLRFQQGK
jgi:hypothetical protein